MQQGAGQITAAGMTKDVIFVEATDSPQAVIDQAYRKKYANSPYLSPMIGERAQPPPSASIRAEHRTEPGEQTSRPTLLKIKAQFVGEALVPTSAK